MAYTNEQLAVAFAAGSKEKATNSNKTLYFVTLDNHYRVAYSYGDHYPACVIVGGYAFLNAVYASATTTQHVSKLRYACLSQGLTCFDTLEKGMKNLAQGASPCSQYYDIECMPRSRRNDAIRKAPRARSESKRNFWTTQITRYDEELKQVTKLFGAGHADIGAVGAAVENLNA